MNARLETGVAACQQQDAFPAIAEIFGYGHGYKSRADAQRRGHVGSGYDYDRALQAFGQQFVLQEFAHLAIPFSNEGDHAYIRGVLPRHCAQQRALAHAGAAENSHPLPFAERKEAVDGAHAGD